MLSKENPNSRFLNFIVKMGFGFSFWLERTANDESVKELLFLSRDSFWLKNVWDQEQKIVPREYQIQSKYVYTSRFAQLNPDSQVARASHLKYLSTFIEPNVKYGIVDIGWRGSSLNYFKENFPKSEFVGLYFGSHGRSANDVLSYIGRIRILKYFGFTEFVETIFSAPYPSIINCLGSAHAPEPIFSEDNLVPGLLTFQSTLFELYEKQEVDFFKVREERGLRTKKLIDFLRIRLLFLFPNKESLALFSSIHHSATMGESDLMLLVHANWKLSDTRCYLILWNFKYVFTEPSLNLKIRVSQFFVLIYISLRFLLRKIL
jgi:hypothetical protein